MTGSGPLVWDDLRTTINRIPGVVKNEVHAQPIEATSESEFHGYLRCAAADGSGNLPSRTLAPVGRFQANPGV
jgi:hypothetical protein